MKFFGIVFCGLLAAFLPLWALAASPMEGALDAAARGQEGFRLFSRDSLPDDRERGYELMTEAAWEGDAKSANNVGWLLEHGEFADKDIKGALRWYERAAEQGLPVGALNYVELFLNSKEETLDTGLHDWRRLGKAATLAGRAMLMGRGLPYDARKGEVMLLRGALLGDEGAAETIAQQLEIYPDSFSYLDLAGIAAECDSLLPEDERNIKDGLTAAELGELMLTPSFWYERTVNNEQ